MPRELADLLGIGIHHYKGCGEVGPPGRGKRSPSLRELDTFGRQHGYKKPYTPDVFQALLIEAEVDQVYRCRFMVQACEQGWLTQTHVRRTLLG